ncbi:MAG TPA: NAD(+) synthase [Thermoanaerobaculia bacterium]|nr:NAD(+) synthase [Thermoanaerobaculia bacterium]
MRLVKIAVASLDTNVGAVRSNTGLILAAAREMAAAGVTLGCFSEQCLGGYPPEDLIQWRSFVDAQRAELDRFARETAELSTVLVAGVAVAVGGQIFNCAAVVHGGRILGIVPKEKLPTYNVFYEARTFSRGVPGLALEAGGVPLGDLIFAFDFGTVAVEVCEDVWSPDGPMRRRCYSGAEVVLNLSSSPFRVGIVSTRLEMLATRSADNQATLVYANTVGSQDGLIFDGGGYVFQNGRLMLDAPRFQEGWAACVVDLDRTRRMRQENTTWRSDCEELFGREVPVPAIRGTAPTGDRTDLPYPAPAENSFFLPPPGKPARSPREAVLDDLIEALALGIRDYYRKTGAFRRLGIALSGGRDSLLTLLLAWRAAQRIHEGEASGEELLRRAGETVTAFYMPTRFSGDETRNAAAVLCRELGIELRVVPIEEAFDREVEAAVTMLAGEELTDLTRQNVQARLRATRMWNWANSASALFLQAGDMSEKSVGYTTIGGDLEGALSVIANVPKTVVIALLERLHERFGFEGIALTLATEPGPELAAAQTAENELMPFPVLDACLALYAGEKLSPEEMGRALRSLFPDLDPERLAAWAERFATLFTRSIYKWVQSPLSLHVGSLDLDRERALQLPVVQANEWG